MAVTRATVIHGLSGEPALEGVWVDAIFDGASVSTAKEVVAIIAPPHPLMGGHLSNPVVEALAEGFARAGVRSLAFNFRGVGSSQGRPSGDPADAEHDFSAALRAAVATATPVLVAGYSFGGAAAIAAAARREGLRVLAVAPPPALFSEVSLAALDGRLGVIAGQHDTIAPPDDLRWLVEQVSGGIFHIVPGADHFFGGVEDEIRRVAADFASR